MFTGIVETMGVVKRITPKGEDALLELESGMDMKSIKVALPSWP
jgi:riboflavin synthase alpha subunit